MHHRNAVPLLIAAVLVFGVPGTAAGGGRTGGVEPPMDFRVSRFPLARLEARERPFYSYAVPGFPLPWKPTDADGIVMREFNGRLYYHPLQLAYAGFRLLSGYRRTGDTRYLAWARRYAAKIREIAVASGGALYLPYRFKFPPHEVRAPWFSGMAQGVALTFFVRMHGITGEPGYLQTANGLFASFWRSGPSDRPWVSRISPAGYLWIEEYPDDDHHDRVLNGFIFAIYGLYEYWLKTGGSRARQMLEGALTTLRATVLHYRVPGGVSYYCLHHRLQLASYHPIHIRQLDMVAAMSGRPFFAEVAELFRRDIPPDVVPREPATPR